MKKARDSKKHPPPNHKRREMAKKVAVGVSLAGAAWQKPVVEHVILPAHAQTSPSEVTCVKPLVCAVAGSFRPTTGTNICGTITSLSATICPPEAGRTIVIDLIRSRTRSPLVFTLSSSTLTTNNNGVVTDTGTSLFCDPYTTGFLARFTLLDAPHVVPCEASVAEI